MSPKIKICGIRTVDEIKSVNEAGIDYVGFVFASSKRRISVEEAVILRKQLSKNIQTVAVVLNPEEMLLNEIIKADFDIIQWHGSINERTLSSINAPLWQAIGVDDDLCIENEQRNTEQIMGYVLDNKKPGSGETFDWNLINREAFTKDLILAGGLNGSNIEEAIRTVNPTIVDVSSGVENETGKDKTLIDEFVRKVRSYDKQ